MKRSPREYWFEPTARNTGFRPIHWKGWALSLSTPAVFVVIAVAYELGHIDITALIVAAVAAGTIATGLAIWRCDWRR